MSQPWNLRRAWHLHRRAGLGANWLELQQAVHDGKSKTVTKLVSFENQSSEDDSEYETIVRSLETTAASTGDVSRLQAAWIYRLLFTGHPLTERLTLVWHNHFATSQLKVNSTSQMLRQNRLLREHAGGQFADLLVAAVKDPAMLIWLDAATNRAGNPNENLARELMELFTLGTGNFGEQDVKEVARALTGWTVRDNEYAFDESVHDAGQKTILGRQGNFDGDAVLRLLLTEKATYRRVVGRVVEMLCGVSGFPPSNVSELAERMHSQDLVVTNVVREILLSDAFGDESNIGNQVLGPVVWMIGLLRHAGNA